MLRKAASNLKLWRATLPHCASGVALMHANASSWEKGDDWIKSKTMAELVEYEENLGAPELISFAQRAKNILSSHWRCQLSTVPSTAKRDQKVYASLVQYGFFQKPYVCLSDEDKVHKANLLLDGTATIIVGHTDPPALMETVKLLGKVPPHVIVSGILAFAEESEVKKVKEGISAINSEAKDVAELGGHALGPIFESSEQLLDSQFEARTTLLKPESEMVVYFLRPRSCQYVDLAGEKHEVDITQGWIPSIDPFAALHAGIVEGINQSDTRRFALKVFCMVYRHVNVEEAVMYSVDRKGFDVLAKVHRGVTSSEWKAFRFNFRREARDAIGLCRQLVGMEKECWETLSRSPALASVVANAAAANAAAKIVTEETNVTTEETDATSEDTNASTKNTDASTENTNVSESETELLVSLL